MYWPVRSSASHFVVEHIVGFKKDRWFMSPAYSGLRFQSIAEENSIAYGPKLLRHSCPKRGQKRDFSCDQIATCIDMSHFLIFWIKPFHHRSIGQNNRTPGADNG